MGTATIIPVSYRSMNHGISTKDNAHMQMPKFFHRPEKYNFSDDSFAASRNDKKDASYSLNEFKHYVDNLDTKGCDVDNVCEISSGTVSCDSGDFKLCLTQESIAHGESRMRNSFKVCERRSLPSLFSETTHHSGLTLTRSENSHEQNCGGNSEPLIGSMKLIFS